MSNRDRFQIFPSRANHVYMKQRLASAQKGLSLLKRKRDALELKLRELNSQLRQEEIGIEGAMSEALFSLSKANFLCTDFKAASLATTEKSDVYLRTSSIKVVGVVLPTFELHMRPPTAIPFTGLSRGGEQVGVVREKFQEALGKLVNFASLRYSVQVLKQAVTQNNMRVNGLDYVVIPRMHNTINYIRDELDEFEREDFYRLKRSQAKQRVNKEKFTAMIEARAHAPEVEKKESESSLESGIGEEGGEEEELGSREGSINQLVEDADSTMSAADGDPRGNESGDEGR